MHLAALLLAALAAPDVAGGGAPVQEAAALAIHVHSPAAQALTAHDAPRPARARAPLPPAMRRLVRKRDLLAPELPTGGRETCDRSVSLLEVDLTRCSTSRLGQIRAHPERPPIRLRLVIAGLLTEALHTPPPTLPG